MGFHQSTSGRAENTHKNSDVSISTKSAKRVSTELKAIVIGNLKRVRKKMMNHSQKVNSQTGLSVKVITCRRVRVRSVDVHCKRMFNVVYKGPSWA